MPPWESTGEDLLTELEHPKYGRVWDLENGYSLAHRHVRARGECRCAVDCNIEVLWEGKYVDYGLVKLEIEQLRQMSLEISNLGRGGAGGGGGGFGGFGEADFGNGAGFAGAGAGRGRRGELGGLYELYRWARLPQVLARTAQGKAQPYDIRMIARYGYSLSNWLGMAGLGTAFIGVGGAVMVIDIASQIVKQHYEEVNRIDIAAGNVKKKLTEQEYWRTWGT